MDEEKLEKVVKAVEEAGVKFALEGSEDDGAGRGWDGGVIWLVPTDRPIPEWKPIATRTL